MGNVLMKHPDRNDDIIEVTEQAYEVVWKSRGWELVNPYTETPQTAKEPEVEETWSTDNYDDPKETRLPVLEEIEEDELRAIAENLGIEGWNVLTANELRSLISNTPEFYDQTEEE